jgi:hypothetical protein
VSCFGPYYGVQLAVTADWWDDAGLYAWVM